MKIHSCWGATLVPRPFSSHTSIFTGSGYEVACRHSCLPKLCLSSLCAVYSKYWKQPTNQTLRLFRELTYNPRFFNSFINNLNTGHTWFPPMLWHTYIITAFPPLFFSPTSRHVWDPKFLIYMPIQRAQDQHTGWIKICKAFVGRLKWRLTAPNWAGCRSGTKASG